ncbi:hypothetical protein [Brucella pituitosa]
MSFSNLLRDNREDVALVIGNGVHRYGPQRANSWEALLLELARRNGVAIDEIPTGASATELFDVIELHARSHSGKIARDFCNLMRDWRPLHHHRSIVDWAIRHSVPVLTTNFDDVLSEAADARLMRPNVKGFTDWYPWDSRYALELHDNPCDGFGIWHINGMAHYARSIRLGLTHYMGSVQRTRDWLHRGEERLFEAKDRIRWAGRRTWVHLIFNKPLLIFGLGLRENEVFLRWLLIERARYFAKFEGRRQPAWYVYTNNVDDLTQQGRHFFLEQIGIQCIEASNYDTIYANPEWEM